jgi:hypothetical protein
LVGKEEGNFERSEKTGGGKEKGGGPVEGAYTER